MNIAIQQGNNRLVRQMLDNGEDVNQVDDFDRNALIMAAANMANWELPGYLHPSPFSLGLFREILYKTNDVNAKDWMDNTALMHACSLRRDLTFLEILLNYQPSEGRPPLDVNARNRDGNTALHYAINVENGATEYNRAFLSRLLQDNRIDYSIRNDNGDTASDIAVRRHNETFIDMLRKRTRSINCRRAQQNRLLEHIKIKY